MKQPRKEEVASQSQKKTKKPRQESSDDSSGESEGDKRVVLPMKRKGFDNGDFKSRLLQRRSKINEERTMKKKDSD